MYVGIADTLGFVNCMVCTIIIKILQFYNFFLESLAFIIQLDKLNFKKNWFCNNYYKYK